MTPAVRRRVRELAAWLRSGISTDARTLRRVTRELALILDTDHTFAYGLDIEGEHVRLAFLESALPGGGGHRPHVAALIEQTPAGFAHYDPRVPPRDQRNVVVTLEDLRRSTGVASTPMLRLGSAQGFARGDQLRVLICDGPAMLAWVGATRDLPFGAGDRKALKALVRPLRDRLALERHLERVPWAFEALETALDLLGTAAVVVRRPLRLLHVNAPAAALLARGRAGFTAGLREELEGRGDGRWLVTPLERPEAPRHYLALLRRAPRDASAPAIAAGARYGLTRRQVVVLEAVGRGEANKSIASVLGCSEGAIEQHVTSLLRRYGVESRAQLVARFWTDAPSP